jgi:bifunctional DNA-binding transcriptional regulator/antitoxin component of YhaV-PrlF toxin-antitoxin module
VLTFETRRVQSNGRSLVTVIPKPYTDYLEIDRGDLIKFQLQKDPIGRTRIIIEKINLDYNDPGKMTTMTP